MSNELRPLREDDEHELPCLRQDEDGDDDEKSCNHEFSDDEDDPEQIQCKKCLMFSNFNNGSCINCGAIFKKDKAGYYLGDGFIEEEEVEEISNSDNDSAADEKELSDYETSDEEDDDDDEIVLSDNEEWVPSKKIRLN